MSEKIAATAIEKTLESGLEAYADVISRMHAWCAQHGLSFRWAMARAALRYMGEDDPARLDAILVDLTDKQIEVIERFETAKRLLRETNLTTGDIARQLGYAGAENLRQLFYARAGITPRQWRTAIRAEA